ncbi:MAG: SDR family NAD(P)-dependent oxidoreductase, partial [Dehalococcoidia bacterium]|nr:SDR family NAD(P)-dependent oxidoreductase [Dehalococcoidia bacterium]
MKPDQLFELGGKVAIVTGGNGGLGLGMALGLAGAGADILVAARDAGKTAQALPQILALGVRAQGLSVDVAEEGGVERMVAEAIESFG